MSGFHDDMDATGAAGGKMEENIDVGAYIIDEANWGKLCHAASVGRLGDVCDVLNYETRRIDMPEIPHLVDLIDIIDDWLPAECRVAGMPVPVRDIDRLSPCGGYATFVDKGLYVFGLFTRESSKRFFESLAKVRMTTADWRVACGAYLDTSPEWGEGALPLFDFLRNACAKHVNDQSWLLLAGVRCTDF